MHVEAPNSVVRGKKMCYSIVEGVKKEKSGKKFWRAYEGRLSVCASARNPCPGGCPHIFWN